MASTPLLDVNTYVTIAATKKGQRDASLSKLSVVQTLADCTDRKIIPFFLSPLSNILATAVAKLLTCGVATPSKTTSKNTDNRPLMRGERNIYTDMRTRRMASLASDKGFTNSMVVNRLSVPETLQ